MAKGCTKCKPTECEECPEWIFTFADLVMLMMGFFVILWVLKPNPTNEGAAQAADEEWMKVVAAIREAFGHIPESQSKDPIDLYMLKQRLKNMKPAIGPGEGGQTMNKAQGAQGTDPEVTSIRKGKQSAIGGRLLFDAADARLTPESTNMLDQIARQIRGHRQIVMIKGHASLDDYGDAATPEKLMDISIRRAQAVADYLTTHNVEPDILRVQGCSTFEPVAQHRFTANSQANNRRVEVEVTSTLVSDLQDKRDKAPELAPDDNPAPANAPAGDSHGHH